ncbi:unnamed protein product [Zymoseptoria tritici ST99CH_1E4]|uniref:Uncharacterized protein n=1 Tax=Zymoseptoria tritici ST99CH_1E4 TaxID=1276532 RepID=A0A2H1GF60_ZYMTR|nr:unnamed protein product [Zymoseptoria tritici ST99CH_1E4]
MSDAVACVLAGRGTNPQATAMSAWAAFEQPSVLGLLADGKKGKNHRKWTSGAGISMDELMSMVAGGTELSRKREAGEKRSAPDGMLQAKVTVTIRGWSEDE